ncbi:MAG: hypothetical protein LDLANPLL_02719 [Turneriella sp.]|nr:hypothetical protein [Turneriella sp.]
MAIWQRVRIFSLSLILMLGVSACLTTRNTKDIEEYKSPINELDRRFVNGQIAVFHEAQMRRINDTVELQFSHVLIGRDRYLNATIQKNEIRFFEADTPMQGGERAYLWQQNACCIDEAAHRKLLFLKAGEELSLPDFLRQGWNGPTTEVKPAAALFVLDTTNVYTLSAMAVLWQDEKTLLKDTAVAVGDYNVLMHDIPWKQRSRVKLALLYAFYGVSVPVDIVTSPFQLLALWLYGKGMR